MLCHHRINGSECGHIIHIHTITLDSSIDSTGVVLQGGPKMAPFFTPYRIANFPSQKFRTLQSLLIVPPFPSSVFLHPHPREAAPIVAVPGQSPGRKAILVIL